MRPEPVTNMDRSVKIAPSLPVYDATALTQGRQMAILKLNGQAYTLRITKQGKLLLTK